jgi:FkbM family methyltransferase
MTFTSYAQNFEDVMLWRAFGSVKNGRYLDIGAQDPVLDSVSQVLYQSGWRGIHVEPMPYYAEALRVNRPDETVIEAVVSNSDRICNFYSIPDTGLSTGVKAIADRHRSAGWAVNEISVPSIRLSALFDMFAGKDIHWMKVDVEGMEKAVLDSWGDHRARPWIVLVESTSPMETKQTHALWIDLMLERSYEEVYFDGLNRYFVSAEHVDLKDAFHAPPNIFDRFTVLDNHFSAQKIVHNSEIAKQEARQSAENDKAELRAQIIVAQQNLISVNSEFTQLHISSADEILTLHAAQRSIAERHEEALQMHVEETRALELRLLQQKEREVEAEAQIQQQKAMLEQELGFEKELHAQSNAHNAEIIAQKNADIIWRNAAMEELSIKHAALMAQFNYASRLIAVASRSDFWGFVPKLQRFLGGPQKAMLYNQLKQNTLGDGQFASMVAPQATGIMTCNGEDLMSIDKIYTSPPKMMRASTLQELLGHDDSDFVQCAYLTVLGRPADDGGYNHYLGWIRRGAAKQSILWQLRRSAEGKAHDPLIGGLDRELRKYRLATRPIVGALMRWLYGAEGRDGINWKIRVIQNDISMLRREQHQHLDAKLHNQIAAIEAEQVDHIQASQCTNRQVYDASVANALPPKARDIYTRLLFIK